MTAASHTPNPEKLSFFWKVPLSDLDYGPEEEAAVLGVLRSRWLTMGEVTRRFEEAFAAAMGLEPACALAVGNGTHALHLACLALNIGPGDEVIVPSLTFVATANAVRYTGAAVRFADVISLEDLTMDPASIEAQITPRTKAILVMHYAGYPCRMPEIMALAERYGLAVIEDAAHAPGASLNGVPLGRWGDIGCFSFFSNKNLAVGEGGMVVTRRPELAEKMRLLRSHGMTTLTWDRHRGHAYSYDVVELGYNYRMDEIRAALGLVQLEKLAANNACRRALTARYWAELADLEAAGCLVLPFARLYAQTTEDCLPSAHVFPILLGETEFSKKTSSPGVSRPDFVAAMKAAGVQTSLHYPPIHQFSHYRKYDSHSQGQPSLPITEAVAAREVTLPLFPTMTPDQQGLVIETIRRFLLQTINE